MAITRWDPFRELETISDRLNRFFGRSNLLGDFTRESLAATDWAPSVDVAESAEEYTIKAELPAVRKEDVKVTIENHVLTVSGERKHEKDEKTKKVHRVERFQGSFMRSFVLPENVDESKLTADYKDGLLTLHIPKTAAPKEKALEVKVS